MTGGRNKTRTVSQIETTLAQIDKQINNPATPAQVVGRLLQTKGELLCQERESELAQKREKANEQLAALRERLSQLEAENVALKEKPAVVVNSSTDTHLQAHLEKLRGQLHGALDKIKILENQLATEHHNCEREVTRLTRENEVLRDDAAFGRQVHKERRIEELRKKVAEYDARLLLPNMGIPATLPKLQFEQLLASEKRDRDELDELLGIVRKSAKPVPLHPDLQEHRAQQERDTAEWNLTYSRNASEAKAQAFDIRSIPRMPNGDVKLYGYETEN